MVRLWRYFCVFHFVLVLGVCVCVCQGGVLFEAMFICLFAVFAGVRRGTISSGILRQPAYALFTPGFPDGKLRRPFPAGGANRIVTWLASLTVPLALSCHFNDAIWTNPRCAVALGTTSSTRHSVIPCVPYTPLLFMPNTHQRGQAK